MHWGKKLGGDNPQLIDGDNFRMIIAVPEFDENSTRSATVRHVDNVTVPSTPKIVLAAQILGVNAGNMICILNVVAAASIVDLTGLRGNYHPLHDDPHALLHHHGKSDGTHNGIYSEIVSTRPSCQAAINSMLFEQGWRGLTG